MSKQHGCPASWGSGSRMHISANCAMKCSSLQSALHQDVVLSLPKLHAYPRRACWSSFALYELNLNAPGLVYRMRDDGDPCVMCTYSRVSCLEQEPPKDITDYWADPVSYFLIQGADKSIST